MKNLLLAVLLLSASYTSAQDTTKVKNKANKEIKLEKKAEKKEAKAEKKEAKQEKKERREEKRENRLDKKGK
jgi:hypothetical protein